MIAVRNRDRCLYHCQFYSRTRIPYAFWHLFVHSSYQIARQVYQSSIVHEVPEDFERFTPTFDFDAKRFGNHYMQGVEPVCLIKGVSLVVWR